MQYLLMQREYDELMARPKITEQELRLVIQDLCTKVADHMPVEWGWGEPGKKPWRCILTHDKAWYCDKCPVQNVCPNERKEWSK